MKKILVMAVVAGTFAFTSCSKDDDGGDSKSDCITCSMSMEGMEISNKYCDNGDGTYTQTSDGVEHTFDIPGGVTFDDLIAAQEALGMSCN